MNLKQQILKALQNPDFPDFKLLYSGEALELAPEILEELLDQERKDFETKLQTQDEDISFETFEDFSLLDYYFSLLEHYQGIHGDDVIRKIVEDFEPKYIDFGNEVAYSKRYYEMLKICIQQNKLDEEQGRIIQKSIERFEHRGIDLPQEKQEELKSISKDLSELSQKFSNNVVDSKKDFEYIITDEKIISKMPEDDKEVAKKKYEGKYNLQKAKSEEEIQECFHFFQKMWQEEFNIFIKDEQFQRFKENEIFYIKKDVIIGCIQMVSIDEEVCKHDVELVGVANIGEKLLGRIGVLKAYRGKKLGTKMIKYVQNYYANNGENRIFLPSAVQNEQYYTGFGFESFSKPVNCGNTQKIMMQCDLRLLPNTSSESYLFDASQSSYLSIMKYCSDTEVRKYFYEGRHRFASEGKYSNKEIILKILKLRDRKAQILGARNYAELSLKFKMVESPEQIIEMFSDISGKAKPKAQAEIDEICEYFRIDSLQNWDLSYYANKLREEKYAFDSKELKKYFRFEDVLAGMFEITKKLYGIEMKKLDIESYSEDIEIYEVYRNGEFLSYFFTDYFYNDLKRPGAWANILREKYGVNKKLVLNVCNFQKGADGVTLLPLSDVETMFHEFGHAIHEMLSKSTHSELSGFHVEWDFVELPSQLLENWCREKEGMDVFARHYETGAKVPDDMHKKMKQLDTFGNGQMILTQNTFAMLDMMFHSESLPETPDEIDEKVIQNYQENSLLPMGEIYAPHLTFTHIFDGGYAAGYYSYMWAEIIEKEVWKAFKDSGDIFSPEVAQKFLETILSAGSTKKASELFRDFFGRDVEIDAFLQEKGLI